MAEDIESAEVAEALKRRRTEDIVVDERICLGCGEPIDSSREDPEIAGYGTCEFCGRQWDWDH